MGGDDNSLWLTRFVERGYAVVGERPFLASLLTFGPVPVLLSLPLLPHLPDLGEGFLLGHGFAVGLLVLLPALIWYYDRRVLPGFFEKATELVASPDVLAALEGEYTRLFARGWKPIVALWTALILGVFLTNPGFTRAAGIARTDPAYLALLAFFAWGGVVTGVGFHGIAVTLRCIEAVASEFTLEIDPLHPDGLGGLSAIGYFAIRTTVLCSAGALLLPYAFEIAAHSGFSVLVYAAILVYMAFIAASFLYPTNRIHVEAQRIRRAHVNDLREDISELRERLALRADSGATPTQEELAAQLEIQRLRSEFDDYQRVNLYPMSPNILGRLVGSVLLPLAFIGLELGLKTLF